MVRRQGKRPPSRAARGVRASSDFTAKGTSQRTADGEAAPKLAGDLAELKTIEEVADAPTADSSIADSTSADAPMDETVPDTMTATEAAVATTGVPCSVRCGEN